MTMLFPNIRIVLVEPAGPLNVGSVARIMKNMGLTQLWLVNPQCNPLDAEARQMAVHAPELLETATTVASLPEALGGCQRAIATTTRSRKTSVPLETARTALPWLFDAPSALIFGPEDRGLNNLELNYAQRWVTIPSHPDYPSLNLAQAVAICCYELFTANHSQPQPQPQAAAAQPLHPWEAPRTSEPLAQLDALEGYFQHLESMLLTIGYLHPHTAASRMEKFRQIYKRSQLAATELALLRGVLRQVEWKVSQLPHGQSAPPRDPPN